MKIANFRKQFEELILLSDGVIITAHRNPDPDSIASSLFMKYVLTNVYNKYSRIVFKDKIKAHYSFLDSERVIQTGDPLKLANENTTVIVLDVCQYKRFSNVKEGKVKCKFLIALDHHSVVDNDRFDLLINNDASSVVEVIYDIWRDKIHIEDSTLAEILLCGIIDDTGSFQYSVSKNTFKVASRLMSPDVDISSLYSKVLPLNEDVLKIVSEVIKKSIYHKQLCIFTITPEHESKYGTVNVALAREFITKHVFNSITSILWAVIIRPINGESTSNKFKIRLLSQTNDINMNDIAEQYDGGGHAKSSGMTYKGNLKELTQIFTDYEDSLDSKR